MPKDNEKEISFFPTKRFFIDTLTKDVKLEDAILDLIDNSIDSYILNNLHSKKNITINFNSKSFSVEDECGGIGIDKVYNEVFRLGAIKKEKQGTIGYYGIGLKRAMFKIGRDIKIESDDGQQYFSIAIDDKWLSDDTEWNLSFAEKSDSKNKRFFKMSIKKLYPGVSEEFSDIQFQERLIKKIRKYFSIHIQKKVNIFVNNNRVIPYEFSFLDDGTTFKALKEEKEVNGVKINIIAGFSRDEDLQGWCIFCNDRIVLMNDTSYKTGFRNFFHHGWQDNEFLGLVFFNSKDPSKLPMKSSKDDIILEDKYYRAIVPRMVEITKELIRGLPRKIYAVKDEHGESIGKSVYEGVKTKKWYEIPKKQEAKYPILKVEEDKKKVTEYTSISFRVKKTKIKAVKKHMSNPAMPNKDVGKRALDYYVKLEGITYE